MPHLSKWTQISAFAAAEWRHLVRLTPSTRVWRMPFAAALASGLPLCVGAWFGRMDYGLVSSLGGMVFLSVPPTPLRHSMVVVMASGFGMIACYAIAVISHFAAPLITPALALIAMLATMASRLYALPPPGSFFFVMAAAIGIFSPAEVADVPLRVGLLAMGVVLAVLIAFLYSLASRQASPPQPPMAKPSDAFDFVVVDSVVIAAFLGLSLGLAQALQMERAYWVPVSCLAVMQAASLRALWTRQVHRIIGTGVGLLLAWGLLALPLGPWSVALLMTLLAFVIETLVVRHYGLAVVFITPMAILLAEAAGLGHGSPTALISARFYDTALGCTVGLIGGACLHSVAFRRIIGDRLRRLTPAGWGV